MKDLGQPKTTSEDEKLPSLRHPTRFIQPSPFIAVELSTHVKSPADRDLGVEKRIEVCLVSKAMASSDALTADRNGSLDAPLLKLSHY